MDEQQRYPLRRQVDSDNSCLFNSIAYLCDRSNFNEFVFHLSNPLMVLCRNALLKYLTKNKKFLENYLGKVYKS